MKKAGPKNRLFIVSIRTILEVIADLIEMADVSVFFVLHGDEAGIFRHEDIPNRVEVKSFPIDLAVQGLALHNGLVQIPIDLPGNSLTRYHVI